ncbi:protein EDS1B [Ricinus communis]|uniref:Lipase, putative n=1 Tax=Ricinus communis TaxID=3988 RepID=B9R8Z8_RICCO|nr:protein EDS1B [Ricinus communis]EEF52075.1 lipase, putative [Ricinus communis]|eukprot:XP_002511473.1 protein EDS1B [Ricinus communis]
MGSVSLGESVGIKEEVIKKACSMAMKAHNKTSGKQLYVSEKIRPSSEIVFSFPGSWFVTDWFSKGPFGEVEVDLQLLPSLKHVGLNGTATVNEAFLLRFKALVANPQFRKEVGTAVMDGKQVVFTGHSLGGPIAILAAIWFLDEYIRPDTSRRPPLCVTFGSPLVGDRIMSHAVRRESWSRYFINFVMKYDIVPRISLTPLSSIQQQLQLILNFFNSKSLLEPVHEAVNFYVTVMRNVSSVASHAACKIMGSTNLLLETLSSFMGLSPYRPFGTYVFCTGNGKLVVIRNPDAVLQLLFYTSQLNSEAELSVVAQSSLKDHLNYKDELEESLQMQTVTCLENHHLEALPLSSDDMTAESNLALNDLGLSARARLCLRATGELEKQKSNNQRAIDKKMADIEHGVANLQGYKKRCQHKVGYYDAFKLSEDREEFDANVERLKLAGIWDEIIEMLKRYELPDEFEGRKAWIDVGTKYRRIVEPLDIANYYRHLKNEDTGPYMERGRPKRYKCTQRWREHAERMSNESLESCFWAEVEELCMKAGSLGIRENVLRLKSQVEEWIRDGVQDQDVFLKGSTFDKLLKEHFLTNLGQPPAFQGSWS